LKVTRGAEPKKLGKEKAKNLLGKGAHGSYPSRKMRRGEPSGVERNP